MKKVYVAFSMTNGDQNLEKINQLIDWLKCKKYKVFQPNYSLFPELLANNALKSIDESDIVIADVTNYSHGVGFELGYAFCKGKKIIIISHCSAKNNITKFFYGLFDKIVFYNDTANVPSLLIPYLFSESGKKESKLHI